MTEPAGRLIGRSRHAKAAELAFGDGDYHCEQVARHLGL